MPTVRLVTPLRRLAGGRAHVAVPGDDVGAVLAGLVAVHPRLRERLLDDDGDLHGFVNVFVGERRVAGDGLATPVGPDEVVTIVPAVAGGAAPPS